MPLPEESESLDYLLAQVSHLHHMRAQQLLEGIGLHRGQPPVLFALWERDGRTQSELADQMHITPATLTKMLQRMEKAGFIQRKADLADQRISRVYLTEAGRSIQAQVEQVLKTADARTFEGFTPDERETLRRFLLQVRQNLLKEVGEQPF